MPQKKTSSLTSPLETIGSVALFALRVIRDAFHAPFELFYLWQEIADQGWRSLPLIVSSGLAMGMVMTLHTRNELIKFGASASIPQVQALSFFVEIGPLVAALLLAGRVGAAMGASLAEMRATEQIDAIEALSIDSFKLLVVPRVAACFLALPLLTTFMDFCGVLSGFLSEHFLSHISLQLYVSRAFRGVEWSNFIPPTLKTAVFGFIIGTVSCFFGYTTDEGAEGVRKAATSSVVVSSLLIILADVILVKIIFVMFPQSAL
ncbi:MAG TPA: ABC transporter permease [Terriglobales bacterium]|nr:ABC transporter permease [Terriglobales bacterium]